MNKIDELFSTLSIGKIRPTPKGVYSENLKYEYLDIVTYNGEGYICANMDGATAGRITDTVYWQKFAERGTSSLQLTFATRTDYENSDTTRPTNSALIKTIIDSINSTIVTIQQALSAINTRLDSGTVNNANTVGGRSPDSFGCVNSCSWTCMSTCTGSCNNGCAGACLTTCSGACISTCSGACISTCTGACMNTCTSGCSYTCKGTCDTRGN